MPDNQQINRREFMKLTAGAGAGLVLGVNITACSMNAQAGEFQPNIWVKIGPDGTVTLMLSETEMGQGVATSLPMLLAEELEVSPAAIKLERAPLTPEYGYQYTGGSTSIRDNYDTLRKAGAAAREMLREAASRRWGIDLTDCLVSDGGVINTLTDERLGYGELAGEASRLPVPEAVSLKDPVDFSVIGKPTRSAGVEAMVTGATVYGIDVQMAGLKVAAIRHCPHFGGRLLDCDGSPAMSSPGVTAVVLLDNAVAVVADNTWYAERGLEKLQPRWSEVNSTLGSSKELHDELAQVLKGKGKVHRDDGAAISLISAATDDNVIRREFRLPFQAHMPMEPMNCVAWLKDEGVEIWVPTQEPSGALQAAHKALFNGKIPLWERIKVKLASGAIESVKLNVTDIGGAFGRRLSSDFVTEAVEIAKHVEGPVKLTWSRKEDIQHDRFHPAGLHQLAAALDGQGAMIAWSHRFAGARSWASGASDLPYAISNIYVESIEHASVVPVGSWRAVAHVYNSFVTESFLDDVADALGKDPVALREGLLEQSPRLRKTLKSATEAAGWGGKLPEGHFQGVAVHAGFGSHIAHVAQVSVNGSGKIRVHRVVTAIDCGQVINPDGVRAQVEGAIAFGLTAALKSGIQVSEGRVLQSNFHNCQIITMADMPVVDVIILDSTEAPGGVGEIGVPPITAAVANAVCSATGVRPLTMPIRIGQI